MTTIIGIKTNLGQEGIVVCADTQMSYLGEDDELIEKKVAPTYKVIYGKHWMLAHSGGITAELAHFQRRMTSPCQYGSSEENINRMLRTAVDNFEKGPKYQGPHFVEVNQLNTMVRRGVEVDRLHEFVLAA